MNLEIQKNCEETRLPVENFSPPELIRTRTPCPKISCKERKEEEEQNNARR
jgi:hypothetical protein